MKNTKRVGIESGILDLTNNHTEKTIDMNNLGDIGGDVNISQNATPISVFDESLSINKFAFPSDPLAIVCDFKNKHFDNKEIVQILEEFLLCGTSICNKENEFHDVFHNPSNGAKEKANDIRNHFQSKFIVGTLKSGKLSTARKKIMTILNKDFINEPIDSSYHPLLTRIPDLYDEDLDLEYLRLNYYSNKSEYKVIELPVAKTLYPVLKTTRGHRSSFQADGRSHPGASYFWVDEENHIYRIWCERGNRLRPFLDHFFSRESVDFVIHRMHYNKIPSVDLFFYEVEQIQPAEIVYI